LLLPRGTFPKAFPSFGKVGKEVMIIQPTAYSVIWPNQNLKKGERTMQDEKTIVIDINLTRGLVALLALALLVAALLGYLA
jgi:hypothetical protein